MRSGAGQLELRVYPDPCLRVVTEPVTEFDDRLTGTIRGMADIMYLNQGIGLAAPQVGIGKRILVIDTGEGLTAYINPEIVECSKDKSAMEEGCLSLPGVSVNVKRPVRVKFKAQNEKGDFFCGEFEALEAKVFQHEFDHLNGRLLIDYMNPIVRFSASKKIARRKREAKCSTRK